MKRAKLWAVTAAAAAATVSLSGCGFHGLYSASLPGGTKLGNDPITITISFANVLDLVPQSAVKVNDVSVGKVTSVSLDGWVAKVTVKVKNSVKLPSNARAAVKMTSLLGEKYVSLEQPVDAPADTLLTNGSSIPLAHTGTAPEVEEVLGALSLVLNGGGLEQLRTITTELNKALNGNEAAVRDLLGQLNTFVGGLDKRKDDITTALVNIDKLAATLNKQKQAIIDTLATMPQALKILSDDRAKLVTLLGSLSDLGNVATRVIGASQQHLVSSLKSLAPVLEQLTASGSDLPNAFKILLTFPFPVGKSLDFARGDYANLHLLLNLNLGDALCGLSKDLCTLAKSLPSGIASSQNAPNSAAATQLAGQDQLPALVGAGG